MEPYKKVKVISCNYKRSWYRDLIGEEIDVFKKQLYGFVLSKMDSILIMAWWLSEYGCTGWGEVFSNGEPLEYSKANARSIFHNPAFYLSLNALLVQHAGNYNNYLHDEAEEDISEIKKS